MTHYIVQRDRLPDIIIAVDDGWTLTFTAEPEPRCLRIWEGEKLRAAFCNVHGFRDLSIPLAEQTASGFEMPDEDTPF
jgi:hypothetical protein